MASGTRWTMLRSPPVPCIYPECLCPLYTQKNELEAGDGGSARRCLGVDPAGVDAAHGEPAGDASPGAPGSEEPLEETDVQEISLKTI